MSLHRDHPRARPRRRSKKGYTGRWYNEGRLAAITGGLCPYMDNYRTGQWFAGYRYERELMQIRGQIAANVTETEEIEDELR